MPRKPLGLFMCSLLCYVALTSASPVQTDRDTEGFRGPVRSVVVETAQLIPARLRWQQSFRSEAHVVQWLDTPDFVSQFTMAPMRWQGQVVGFVGALYQLLPERRSVFTLAPFQFVMLRPQASHPLPNSGEQVLVAGRVEGSTMIELPVVGPALLPELTVVAIASSVPPAHWAAWTEEPRLRGQTMTFDTQGQMYDAAFYNTDGTLRWRWRFTYTAQGRRMERTSTDTADVPRWTLRYIYDAAGRLREKVELAADQSLARRWEYQYDKRGLVLQESNYDAKGTLLWQWRYAYNAKKQRSEESNHTANGALLWRRQYVYNPQGHMAEEQYYDAANTLMWRRQYTYDTHGNRLEELLYKANGDLESRWRYTYDTYDTYGNWVKRTESKWVHDPVHAEFGPAQVTYRTLLYY